MSAFAGTHASGRAGWHLELFDFIFNKEKKNALHVNIVYAYSI